MSSDKSKDSNLRIKTHKLNIEKFPSPKSLASSPFIALASGILMGLTVAPVGAWFLAWIALAPLWVLEVKSPKHPNKSFPYSLLPTFYSLLWGIGYHGVALFWITGIHPMTWMGVPWINSLAIALFCWIFITLWGAALVVTWAIGMRVILNWGGLNLKQETLKPTSNLTIQNPIPPTPLKKGGAKIQNPLTRILIGTALWCGLESLWSAGSLYWSSLAYTQSPHNLAILHLGQISGDSTITAAIVLVNALLAEAWINRQPPKPSPLSFSASSAPLRFVPHKSYLTLAAGLLIGLHLLGYALYTRPLTQPPETALKVGIIQGNVPNQIKLYPEGIRRAIEGYTQGYKTLADHPVDAVLTPEGALPFMWNQVMRSSFYSAVKEKGVVAWVGAFGQQGRSYTNSLFTLTGTGEVYSRYNKVKLVPIGEYIPFEQYLGGLIERLSPLDEHQVAGNANQVFETPFGRAIVVICYGSAFPEQFRYQAEKGGQFILSPSNDAHYSAAMPAQHHALDVMRAIETDRWGVRATNTGYSAVVDPHGRTVWISGHNTYELHAHTIYRRQTQTLYVRWGDWLTGLLLVLGILGLLASKVKF